ncbi:hypothetical protein [Mycobacterium seoulense]|uniref:hypothetical protein n=1 Tax=Mycobacterium seoulense TaxID=386911 RepID=UPI003CF81D09
MRANIKHVVLVTALSCTVAGCQSHANTASGPQSGSASAAPSARTTAKPIDACSMLSPQDISGLLGVTVQGKSTGKDPQMGDCSWENPSTMESISLQISNPGTARNNTLPPPEAGFPDPSKPGPDGMRLLGGGQVEFAAGNRVNTVQVAVLKLSPDQANSAAIDLARKISPQVPN